MVYGRGGCGGGGRRHGWILPADHQAFARAVSREIGGVDLTTRNDSSKLLTNWSLNKYSGLPTPNFGFVCYVCRLYCSVFGPFYRSTYLPSGTASPCLKLPLSEASR
jgi:hypothetical protein